jgi:hypothetical protein
MSNLVPLRVLSSVASLSDALDGWTLLEPAPEAGERRVYESPVMFESAFANAPLVQVALVGIDASNGDNLRLKVSASNISAGGFSIRVETWFNTRIWSVDVSWFAIGE